MCKLLINNIATYYGSLLHVLYSILSGSLVHHFCVSIILFFVGAYQIRGFLSTVLLFNMEVMVSVVMGGAYRRSHATPLSLSLMRRY